MVGGEGGRSGKKACQHTDTHPRPNKRWKSISFSFHKGGNKLWRCKLLFSPSALLLINTSIFRIFIFIINNTIIISIGARVFRNNNSQDRHHTHTHRYTQSQSEFRPEGKRSRERRKKVSNKLKCNLFQGTFFLTLLGHHHTPLETDRGHSRGGTEWMVRRQWCGLKGRALRGVVANHHPEMGDEVSVAISIAMSLACLLSNCVQQGLLSSLMNTTSTHQASHKALSSSMAALIN